ncbi:MAG: small ribosomal subunit biogenesis GTPase RsgA [Bacteroidales bacterium]|nr:small ribosomal subunit biogenesis GTPase RsgA [Bacteroidales bacterium]
MAKRRLTIQQTRRIADRQRRTAEAVDDKGNPGQEGVVIIRYGKHAAVLPPDFAPEDTPQRCHIRATSDDVVTGDRVIWQPGSPSGIVTARLERSSVIQRPDGSGRLRPVAANVDRIAIVIAPQPEPHPNLIDRYLVAAEHEGIQPLLILNKVDMLAADDPLHGLLDSYHALGYDILRVSALSGAGTAALRAYFARHTTVLVGQSGVGKSSLVNLLYPAAEVRTGELSAQVAKGRHTTTSACLYHLPDGGYLVDSPGIREFSLGHLDSRAVAEGFVEFHPWIGGCRFRDCDHLDEPGCAIRAAVDSGTVGARRYASYRLIIGATDGHRQR